MTTIKEMRSPYVLCCLDIFITEEATYIVTEYCESDLGKLIKQCGKLEKNQVLSLFSQLVKGYHHIRELGYIHRDLKPANILLRGSTAKIADFGFSKQINREGWVK
jgi:serine/threonine protein kinase